MKQMFAVLFCVCVLASSVCVASEAPFEVMVVIPEFGQGGRHLCYAREQCNGPDFHVILKNTSRTPQNVFQVCNSWGYNNISFEMEYDGRRISVVRKEFNKPASDVPFFWVLYPGEYRVYDIYLKEYTNVPSTRGQRKPIKVKAVYRLGYDLYNPLRTFDFAGFWKGRVESAPLEVMVGECSPT
ncbi:MAG: hypothetical protein ABH865_05830 [Candidatus Omnitrophota bacterium]|nr:hypothetical protein [Candidatus Omnitrophota bacterium]